MSREILFKAKRLDNGEWVEGYLFCTWERAYILWGTTNDVPNMIEVDVNTICQYTGLTDMNGKKVWENDVVKEGCNGLVGVVVWDKRIATYKLKDLGDNYTIEDAYIEWEVIGNIFDNPELLEGGEQ